MASNSDPNGRVQRKYQIAALVAAAGSATVLTLAWPLYAPDDISPTEREVCLRHNAELYTEPGESVILDASLNLGACDTKAASAEMERLQKEGTELLSALARAQESGDGQEFARLSTEYSAWLEEMRQRPGQATLEAVVGGEAQLRLAARLFPGEVAPISDVNQVIEEKDSASWAWELRPNKPGDYKISLVLSILDASNEELLEQNERVEVTVHVEGTFSYWAGRAWANTLAFLTSLQGAATSLVAILGAFGVTAFFQKRKKDRRGAEPAGTEPSTADQEASESQASQAAEP
ncbi:hypothetical protein [Geodermatophilus sp. URMC 63]